MPPDIHPDKPQPPPAALIPGPVELGLKEWDVPTPGSRPHDPPAEPPGRGGGEPAAIWEVETSRRKD